MTIDAAACIAPTTGAAGQATPGAAEKFDCALQTAKDKPVGLNALTSPLASLNQHSESLAAQAAGLEARDMKPSELMMLTMRSHEFLFHCELVSNVANRSSDGVQQLFRQQS